MESIVGRYILVIENGGASVVELTAHLLGELGAAEAGEEFVKLVDGYSTVAEPLREYMAGKAEGQDKQYLLQQVSRLSVSQWSRSPGLPTFFTAELNGTLPGMLGQLYYALYSHIPGSLRVGIESLQSELAGEKWSAVVSQGTDAALLLRWVTTLKEPSAPLMIQVLRNQDPFMPSAAQAQIAAFLDREMVGSARELAREAVTQVLGNSNRYIAAQAESLMAYVRSQERLAGIIK